MGPDEPLIRGRPDGVSKQVRNYGNRAFQYSEKKEALEETGVKGNGRNKKE
jgi:hypothetical protein